LENDPNEASAAMLILLLVIVGILLFCCSATLGIAIIDEGFRKILQNMINAVPYASESSNNRPGGQVLVYDPEVLTEDTMPNIDKTPASLDPKNIAVELRSLSKTPPLLDQFLNSIKEQILLTTGHWNSQARAAFLESVTQELESAKKYLNARDNLQFHTQERDIKERELQIRKAELENKRQGQQDLENLKGRWERLKIEVEIAELQKKKEQIENRPQGPPIEPPKSNE
jgi:hypothetical protein